MASTTVRSHSKKPAAPPLNAQAPQQTNAAAGDSKSDTKLLNCIRGNTERIVGSLMLSADRAGAADRQEYVALANQISALTGLGQIQAAPLAMAAGAGR